MRTRISAWKMPVLVLYPVLPSLSISTHLIFPLQDVLNVFDHSILDRQQTCVQNSTTKGHG